MKIVLFGGRGFLGQHIQQLYPDVFTPSVDIADRVAVSQALTECKADIVINAAGKTGRPNVDWCEDHKEETLRANVTGPLILLEECQRVGAYFTHLSSGCIYTGDNNGHGFSEDDEPNFHGSYYSRTKAWCEALLREFPVLILRLRMPFDDSSNPRSLITKVRGFTRVNDVQNSVTYLPDFLRAMDILIQKRKTGIYNIVNPGTISPYEIIELYRNIIDPTHVAERVPLQELAQLSRAGRSNCLLSTKKLEDEGIELLPVTSAVMTALHHMKQG